jgi:hypothetical protein
MPRAIIRTVTLVMAYVQPTESCRSITSGICAVKIIVFIASLFSGIDSKKCDIAITFFLFKAKTF